MKNKTHDRNGKSMLLFFAVLVAAAIPVTVLAVYYSQSNKQNVQQRQDPEKGNRANVANEKTTSSNDDSQKSVNKESEQVKIATFGAGCFWCVEAVFQELDGVHSIKSGYTGGKTKNPTYKDICTGQTGHAEVCRIEYDSNKITFKELLEVFWKTHDPTTLNSQGYDHGTQYRSAVFYHDDEQKELATKYKERLNESGAFRNPIVTEVTKASTFYPCEKYHDNYFKENPDQAYCRAVIRPKIAKFKSAFADKLKKEKTPEK